MGVHMLRSVGNEVRVATKQMLIPLHKSINVVQRIFSCYLFILLVLRFICEILLKTVIF